MWPSQPFNETVWPPLVRLSKVLHNRPSVKSSRLTRAPLLTSPRTHTHTHACVHTCTHTDMHSELGVQGAGSRLQTHNTAPLSYCYTILRPTLTCLFPTFFSCSLRSPPIWNCRLFWELDAGQVSAAMCRTHHE